jgi:hypothetical protein
MTQDAGDKKISRDDLERRFRSLQDDLQGRVENKKQTLVAVGAAAAALLVLMSYLFGRRRGARRATKIEFRR